MKKTKSAIQENATFLTVQEAAEFLHLSPLTIYRRIAQGKLRKFKVGSRTLVRHQDVLGLVREVPTTPATTAT
jgi:excisionase family DNA binding protein